MNDAPGGDVGRARRWLPLVLPASAAVFALVARAAPGAVEELYARGLYPLIAGVVAHASRAWASLLGAPLDGGALDAPRPSLAEVTALLAAVFAAWAAARALRRRGVVGLVRVVGLVLGGLLWAFLALWGLNYAREPLARTLSLPAVLVAPGELANLAMEVAADLSRDLDALARPPGPGGGADVAALRAALETGAAGAGARDAWAATLAVEPELGWTDHPLLVAPLASRGLSAAGISGIFGPFTQECHVAAGLPALDVGFIACHEIAHAQGWAREDEANYLAWRVGIRHGGPTVRVSARAAGLRHVLAALRTADPRAFRDVLRDLDPRALELLEARRRAVLELRVEAVATAARGVNDAYLRGNGQDGVASYGRMVDLMVAERRASER